MTMTALVMAFGILAMRIVVPGLVAAQMLRPLFRPESREPGWKTYSVCIRRSSSSRPQCWREPDPSVGYAHVRAFALDAGPGCGVLDDTPLPCAYPATGAWTSWIERQSVEGNERLAHLSKRTRQGGAPCGLCRHRLLLFRGRAKFFGLGEVCCRLLLLAFSLVGAAP